MKRKAVGSVTPGKKAKLNKNQPRQQKQANDANSDNHSDTTSVPSVYISMFDALKKQVNQQQQVIDELTTRMSFVVSWLESSVTPEQCSSAFNDFAAAVKRPPAAVAPVCNRATQESIVAAVYVDNQRRSKRATNFIVSSLPTSDFRSDHQAVVDLCSREFDEIPDVVHTRRVGKIISGRIQPLLVVLKTAAQAVRFIAMAKKLRQSADSYTKQNIYISANLTKAEARAAYEIRCQRRQAATSRTSLQRQQQQQQQIHTSAMSQPAISFLPSQHHRQQQQLHHKQHQQQTVVAEVHHPRSQHPLQLSHQTPIVSQQYWQQQQQLQLQHYEQQPTMLPRDCVVAAGPTSSLPSASQMWQPSQLSQPQSAPPQIDTQQQRTPQDECILPLQSSQQTFYPSAVPYPAAPAYSSLQLPVPPAAWSVSSPSIGQH